DTWTGKKPIYSRYPWEFGPVGCRLNFAGLTSPITAQLLLLLCSSKRKSRLLSGTNTYF
ncbi:hypothetical protein J6590_011777, partial [Homalodisca vitripennis]